MTSAEPTVALRSARGRGILAATILGSGMAFLDATAVNLALPTIGRELGSPLAGLQWTADAYLLTLTAFLLLGGSLGDARGLRRTFLQGTVGFAATSLLCAVAPTMPLLLGARALQGMAAALLVPGSLAILRSSLRAEDQDAAIGTWTGLSGVTTALGPLLGGWLVEAVSWRAIFLLNLPLAAVAIWSSLRCVPEQRAARPAPLDWAGAGLAALGLGCLVLALIEGPAAGWPWLLVAAGVAGLAATVAFVLHERRTAAPMLPLRLFANRQFAVANLTTLALYHGLSASLFLVVLELQRDRGFSPLATSLVLLPLTVLLLVLSPLAGRAVRRVGYRLPMTVGPVLAAAGLALLAEAGTSRRGAGAFVLGVVVLALGLGTTVAPLTGAVMTAVAVADAGIASAVNNAVARLAGLLGVAVLPGLVGLSSPGVSPARATGQALLISAAGCALGGAAAWLGIPAGRAGPASVAPPR